MTGMSSTIPVSCLTQPDLHSCHSAVVSYRQGRSYSKINVIISKCIMWITNMYMLCKPHYAELEYGIVPQDVFNCSLFPITAARKWPHLMHSESFEFRQSLQVWRMSYSQCYANKVWASSSHSRFPFLAFWRIKSTSISESSINLSTGDIHSKAENSLPHNTHTKRTPSEENTDTVLQIQSAASSLLQ